MAIEIKWLAQKSERPGRFSPLRLAIMLLTGQAFFIGVALAMVYVVGNTLFLVDYGSESLPYIYIITGLSGALFFFGLALAQQRWQLSRLIAISFLGQILLYLLAWQGLRLAQAQWLSMVLMVLFPLGFQFFSVAVGGQAGRLLDLRQLKRYFPSIVVGAIIGFFSTALTVPWLINWISPLANLLIIAAAGQVIALTLFLITHYQFQTQLAGAGQTGPAQRSKKSLRTSLGRPYTLKLFNYQMLSAIGTQLVIYLFLIQAEARYPSETELATFFGNFAGIRNIVSLLFLLALAGPLISRFGLAFGLMVNPVTVVIMVLGMTLGAIFTAPIGATLFWLATLAYVLDNLLSDGVTSTSIKTAYQPLPVSDQATVETAVEGVGVPAALAITGALLLVFNRLPGLSGIPLFFFTLALTIVWTGVAFTLYRNYAGELVANLSRRILNEAALFLDDRSSLTVVTNLLQSNELSKVQLALDLLESNTHERYGPSLLNLIDSPDPAIRREALARLERHRPDGAGPLLAAYLPTETEPEVKAAALRAWCAWHEAEAVEEVLPYLADPQAAIRAGAMVGLLRYGGIDGILEAGERLRMLERGPDPAQRIFVAQVIGQVGLANFYKPLLTLLEDPVLEVRLAALAAAGQVKHGRLLPLLITHLAERTTRSAAMAALLASGETLVPLVGQALAGKLSYEAETTRRLVRICGQVKGEGVINLLRQHLNHPNPALQSQILLALSRCGYRAADPDRAGIEQSLRQGGQYGLRILLAKQDIGPANALAVVQTALDYEFAQLRQRLFLLLSFLYPPRAMIRAEERLARANPAEKAVAIETLEITLSGPLRAFLLPLVDETMPLAQRIQALQRTFSLTALGRDQRMVELISDTHLWADHWLRSCVIYSAGQLALTHLSEVIEQALAIPTPPVRETAAWALHKLAKAKFQQHAASLALDPDPQVAQLTHHLINQA
jgi:HEAT repeat protein